MSDWQDKLKQLTGPVTATPIRDWRTDENKEKMRVVLRAVQDALELSTARTQMMQPHAEWAEFAKAAAVSITFEDEFATLAEYLEYAIKNESISKMFLFNIALFGVCSAVCEHCGHLHKAGEQCLQDVCVPVPEDERRQSTDVQNGCCVCRGVQW